MQRVWSPSFCFVRSRSVHIVPRVHLLVLTICPSLVPRRGYRSILRLSFIIQPFHPLRVFCQLIVPRIQTVPVYLFDKNILAFS